MSLFEVTACLEEILSHWSDVVLFLGSTRRVQQYHTSSVHPQPLDGHILKDDQFHARLHLFSEVLHEVGYRFRGNLTNARDAGFYVYGRVARFIHSLALKCLTAGSVPDSANWDALVQLDVQKCTKLSVEDFGHGTEFRKQLLASKPHQVADFLEYARDFYHDFLVGFMSACRHVIAFSKGFAAFDSNLLYREDSDLAHECLSCLFEMFQQRGWFEHREKPSLIMEYQSFMTSLQLEHCDSSGRPMPVIDAIETYATLPCMADKTLLRRMFHLACLCLPLKGSVPEPITLGLEAVGLTGEAARSLVVPLYSFVQGLGSSSALTFDGEAIQECENILVGVLPYIKIQHTVPGIMLSFTPREEIHDKFLDIYTAIRSAPRKSKSASVPSSLVGVAGAPPVMPPESSGSAARSSLRKRGSRKKGSKKK